VGQRGPERHLGRARQGRQEPSLKPRPAEECGLVQGRGYLTMLCHTGQCCAHMRFDGGRRRAPHAARLCRQPLVALGRFQRRRRLDATHRATPLQHLCVYTSVCVSVCVV
jgi:hypothetical protein